MTLDLEELTAGWECPPGQLRARVVVGRDGQELLQLRVDLGVMQMVLTGRPDGERYRGFPSAQAYIEHELCVVEPQLDPQCWQDLDREMQQLNYRRMAFAASAEDALQDGDEAAAARYLTHALADASDCLSHVTLLRRHGKDDEGHAALLPTLVFDRARLAAQLRIIEGRFEEAIEAAETGAAALEALLGELGYDEELREEDPGLRYLRTLGTQLRREYGVTHTLREQLEEALANEDYEAAARLRDELAARQQRPAAPPAEEDAGTD